MRRSFLPALALCASLAFSVSAHDTLPTAWCPVDTQAVIVSTFSFAPTELAAYRTRQLAAGADVLGSDCGALKTCGIIDEWYWANQLAHDTCSGGVLQRGGTLPSDAPMPFVSAPANFNLQTDTDGNRIKDHHDLYRFKDGLQGTCVVCRPLPKTSTGKLLRTP